MNIVLFREGGPKYKTRNGSVATVLERGYVSDGEGGRIPVLHGRVNGLWTEWTEDGVCRDGGNGCDIEGVE